MPVVSISSAMLSTVCGSISRTRHCSPALAPTLSHLSRAYAYARVFRDHSRFIRRQLFSVLKAFHNFYFLGFLFVGFFTQLYKGKIIFLAYNNL